MISEARMYLRVNSYFYQIGSNPVADQAIAANHVTLDAVRTGIST